jgi:hypothetical protein
MGRHIEQGAQADNLGCGLAPLVLVDVDDG